MQEPEITPTRSKSQAESQTEDRWFFALITIFVSLHILLGIDCARRWSVTHDEYWHLPAGVAVWNEARFDLDNLNPPLTRIWDALPLVIGGANLPHGLPADDAFRLGDEFLKANLSDYHRWFLWARSFNLLLSASVGVLLAIWGRQSFGKVAGVIAGALWLTCPLALSNGALVTPDAGATLFFVATLFAAWNCAHCPTWLRAVIVGSLLGLSQLCKFTNILLFAFVPGIWLIVRCRSQQAPLRFSRQLLLGLVVLVSSIGLWNAGYLFRGSGKPLGDWSFRSRSMSRVRDSLAFLHSVPVPLPADYLAGFDRQRATMEGSHPVYLDGIWNLEGFPGYYAYCAAYKWPHLTQVVMCLGCLVALTRWGRTKSRVNSILVMCSVAILLVASSVGMQLGFRYVMPAMPMLYLFGSQSAQWLWNHDRLLGKVLVCVAGFATLGGLRSHPNHLAYFNEGSGGFSQGRTHLADSNLDWGQDLRELKEYLDENDIKTVRLAYFGMYPPSALNMNFTLPPSNKDVVALGGPPSGWYAVSVNFVLGRPHTIRKPDDTIRGVNYQEFSYLRQFKPVATIGGSIDVYYVPPAARRR